MQRYLYFLAVFMLTVACQTYSQYNEHIDRIISANPDFSGSILIAKNGNAVFETTVGYGDEALRKKATNNTRFNICSIGKMLTATIIFQLVEESKIKLDYTIAELLPGVKIENAERIKVRHLLSHRSGLGNYMTHAKFNSMMSRSAGIDDLMELVLATPAVFDTPGSEFRYSNSGFIVLGKIIESIEKKPYAEVLTARILDPLSMTRSTLMPNLADISGFAKPYIRQNTDNTWISNIFGIPPPSSDGGMYTTARDFLKFDNALYSGKLISQSSLDTMRTVVTQEGFPYGYGMMITTAGTSKAFGHSGGIPGYNSEYRHYFIGKNQYTLIILGNHDRTVRPMLLAIENEIVNENL